MAKFNKKIMKNYLKPRLMNKDENGVRVKIYISGHMIGAGKMELFNLVNQQGSISKAANLMGMSFSRANMLLNTIQEAFEKPVLIKNSGNKGTKLTEFGLELLEKYLKLCEHLTSESKNFINWAQSKQ
jgi:molybdate transport repressor ModE-like protein|tara:strand:- start:4526 stop:4909 length:384 start_codon:yes stop_codon:yes gene_type:complete